MADVRTLTLHDYLTARLTRTINVTQPAAGADFTVTVPAGSTWVVQAVRGQLVSSAVAGNRLPALRIGDGFTELQRIAAVNNQATGLTWVYTWLPGYGYAPATGTIQNLSLGSLAPVLYAGSTIAAVTAAIDVGDQWSGVALQVLEYTVGQIYWMADLLGRELDNEALTMLPAHGDVKPLGTGQPAGPEASQSGNVA